MLMPADIDATLAEWKAKMDAATEGPWELIGGNEYVTGVDVPVAYDDGGVRAVDAEFIAMSRTAVSKLLAAVEAILALCDNRDAAEGAYRSLMHTLAIRATLDDAIGDSDHE